MYTHDLTFKQVCKYWMTRLIPSFLV